ncbi:sugar-binding transcriptional regulator [Alteribacillus sp. YIM 98480]|uniref:sugar-binding transcriptional regulator n=1 Tax=Alteribacillus sp. YIM 98480 TaxID=2606599 RepID=UPI001E345F85|nr:sugar-binding domain-containing protein [Alteribacillus sp. YIM 98480]
MNNRSRNEQMTRVEYLESVVRMYYVLGLTQNQIANQLGVSRSSVARLLEEAKKRGVIRFRINTTMEDFRSPSIEKKFLENFALKDCVVFDLEKEIGNTFEYLTCSYLNSILPLEGSVGIGFGHTLRSVGKSLNFFEPRPNLKFVQLTGGTGVDESIIPTSSNVQVFSQALGSQSIFFPAPTIVGNPELKSLLLKDSSISAVVSAIRQVSMALVGIGHTGHTNSVLSTYFPKDFLNQIPMKDSVGNILVHSYDINGRRTQQDISKYLVGIELEAFRQISLRVGIATGEDKIDAILGALRGNFANILITDKQTSIEVLNKHSGGNI